MWRYAVSGAAVVGVIGGVLAVSMTLPDMITTPDRTVGSTQSVAPSTPGLTPNGSPTQSKPPPPDLLAAQKAAEEAQQAIAAINQRRAAEEKAMAEVEAKAKADAGPASSPAPAQGPGMTPGQAPELAQGQAMPAPPPTVPPAPIAPAGGTAPPGGGPHEAATNSTTTDAALQAQRDALEQQVKQLMAQIQQEKDRLSAMRSDAAPTKVVAAKPSHPEPRQDRRQTDFASVEQIVARLRQEQGYTRPPAPDTAPPPAAPPVPRNVLPLTTAEDMLPLRTAQLELTAGDTARAVSIMASVQARLGEQGGGTDGPPPQVRTYVSALISEAMSLTQAGDGGTASRYLEQAIAELRTSGAAQPTYADGG